MTHKDMAVRSLTLMVALAATFFVVVICMKIVEAAYYLGGYWLSVPTVIALVYALLHATFYTLDRID